MTEAMVIDASAAIAYLLVEPDAPAVRNAMFGHLKRGGHLLVPELFWHEVVNSLVRRGTSWREVVAMLRDLDELPVETATGDRTLLMLGVTLMERHGLSGYDAAYLALANAMNADLLTLDRKLGGAAGPRSPLTRTRGTHETLEPYGTSAAEIVTAHGAYLAELRREAEAGILR